MIIALDEIPIHVIRKSVKNITLRIYPPDGEVKMSVPKYCKEQDIHHFLQTKRNWITTKRNQLLQRAKTAPQKYDTGATISYLGQSYLLICIRHHGPKLIEIKDNLLYCYTHPDATELDIQQQLLLWYRKQLAELIPPLIKKWEPQMNVTVREWGIKHMKTRWGSCNIRAHRIWLNLNLIQKPISTIESVLVHELVHLLEPSHNARFYALMDQFLPDWKIRETHLK